MPKKTYIPKEDSFSFWRYKFDQFGQQYSNCERNYERPWDLSLRDQLTDEEKVQREITKVGKLILQKKAFLSTYRLSFKSKDKMKLIMEIKHLHERYIWLGQKLEDIKH